MQACARVNDIFECDDTSFEPGREVEFAASEFLVLQGASEEPLITALCSEHNDSDQTVVETYRV